MYPNRTPDGSGGIIIRGMTNSGASGVGKTAQSTETVAPAGDELVAELWRLGIRYLSRGRPQGPGGPLPPEMLLSGLAASPEARLRAALVPLFLLQPEYASAASAASELLSAVARVTLQCSYTAAAALQPRYRRQLATLGRSVEILPDIFAAALGLPPTDDASARLAAVAARHALLSGEDINWLGTYEHAVAACLRFAAEAPAWTR
jgi:hypothetical protein